MASGAPQADPSGVAVIASPTDNQYAAPETNPALQLAGALSQSTPKVADFVGQLGSQLQATAEAKAQTAAMQNSAASYAEAVRNGSIAPGQSPWFVQAFNQNLAKNATEKAGAQIVADSQTWAERSYNDGGAAYQDRLQAEFGKLGTQLQQAPDVHPLDALRGFQAAAEPLINQAIAQNHAYNIQRISQEGLQAASTSAALTIGNVLKANPTAAPDAVFQALEPYHAQFIGTGHTEAQWKDLVFQGIRSAANTALDPSILDLAKAPYMGGAPLASMSDLTGRPNSEQLNYDAFQIQRAQDSFGNDSIKGHARQVFAEGLGFYQAALKQFGYGLYDGTVTQTQLREFAEQQGVSPEGFAAGSEQIDRLLTGVTGSQKQLIQLQGNSVAGQQERLSLSADLATKGFTQSNMARVQRDLASGLLSSDQADAMIGHAASTSRSLMEQGRQDAREARSEQHYDAAQARQMASDAKVHGREAREDANAQAITALYSLGYSQELQGPGKAKLETVGNSAHDGWLASHPGDWDGALTAQQAALNKYIQPFVARRRGSQPPPPNAASGAVNPLPRN